MSEKTKKFFNKYFHFFKIPNFVPKKYIKKLKKKWENFFADRDTLTDLIADKDSTLSALNTDGIINAIEQIISNTKTESVNVEKLISNFNSNESDMKKSESAFEEMLNGIIDTQNNYNWYGG